MNSTDEALIANFNELEVRCITGNFESFDLCLNSESRKSHPCHKLFESLEWVLKCLITHDYRKILITGVKDCGIEVEIKFDPIQKSFQCNVVNDHPTDGKLVSYTKELLILAIGISALQEFVRINVCGPTDGGTIETCLDAFIEVLTKENIVEFLSRNGEYVFDNIVQPELLCLSHMFLSTSITRGASVCLTRKWWLMRALHIHQQVLPDRIASIHDQMATLASEIVEMEWINDENNSVSKLSYFMECAQMHLYYHEVARAKKLITAAQNLVGLGIELSGAYGKRTQFQQKAVAQLFVKLRRDSVKLKGMPSIHENATFPADLHLQDDTLLNAVSFIDLEENRIEHLLPEEQIVLMGYCCLIKRSGAFDELLKEEVMSYVNCILEQPKIWSIYLTALILRCKTEKHSSRRLERALMQLEAVIDSIGKDTPAFSVRLPYLYSVAFPMTWTLQKELASMWISVGATKSALAIYEKLNLWEEIVMCYQRLGRTSCAESVIRKQLQIKETPMLWCLLGDVLDDPDMYTRADFLSKGTNARSQCSLGYYYYKRQNYASCLEFFQKSLDINPLQCGVWFALGYAALQCKDYLLAARAYRQVVLLDEDNFEAWNNLSTAYINSKQKERAWRSLQEALKCNYEEWRVWENFLLVSIDIGAFEDVLRAWHRLLDLKGKHLDEQVLSILVRAINEDLPDIYDQPSSRIRPRALQFMGRLSSAIPNDFCIWESYSKLQCPHPASEADLDSLEKAYHHQMKATRFATQIDRWESDVAKCATVLKCHIRFADLSRAYIQRIQDGHKAPHKSSSKLILQSVISRADKNLRDFKGSEIESLQGTLVLLKNILVDIANL